ncbi:high affinity cationic amino acid transporter 1-like isoform X1 [Corythoichthys intestinalis]|uniref:high affinity cationic amino acid transporter 1-like isoform X1 n=1 Tax=Corythoichthys intestinalis TaxID=161448 RepID=UPI0025A529A7|nr:high affinity cationic amino acid transporter 1-like isoform X1 [Corythoichthys intestinalis]
MISASLKHFGRQLIRVKVLDLSSDDTQLSRCLNTCDLVVLGVGSTLGAGVYVVAGSVAKITSGPAIILSFLIASVASILAGLCYAEFGARTPKTGSAYLYSYVTAGELQAFVTGWSLLVSYSIGTSSVARTWSSTFDMLIGGKIQKWSKNNAPMNFSDVLAEYPDIFSVLLVIILTSLLCLGVKESVLVGKVFTSINVLVLIFVMVGGIIKGDTKNWSINPDDVLSAATARSPNTTDHSSLKKRLGVGGFLPFGWMGVFSGAATCFYAFIGFECIATSGEEVKNPQKAIPVGIVSSLLICLMMYLGVSTALTILMPYYLLDEHSPLPQAFTHVGWPIATNVVGAGSLCALSTSLLGAMFPMPRVIWAMAEDGLLFKCLSKINSRTKTPLVATIVSGVIAATMALLFNLRDLVDLMSIGTLLAYTLVAACVVVLRYRPERRTSYEMSAVADEADTEGDVTIQKKDNLCSAVLRLLLRPDKEPTPRSGFAVVVCTVVLTVLAFLFSVVAVTSKHAAWTPAFLGAVAAVSAGVTLVVWRQPQNKAKLSFKVPLVPFIPVVSMMINTYLMMQLMTGPYLHYIIFMSIGLLIYFGYGFHHSVQGEWDKMYGGRRDGRGDQIEK